MAPAYWSGNARVAYRKENALTDKKRFWLFNRAEIFGAKSCLNNLPCTFVSSNRRHRWCLELDINSMNLYFHIFQDNPPNDTTAKGNYEERPFNYCVPFFHHIFLNQRQIASGSFLASLLFSLYWLIVI